MKYRIEQKKAIQFKIMIMIFQKRKCINIIFIRTKLEVYSHVC